MAGYRAHILRVRAVILPCHVALTEQPMPLRLIAVVDTVSIVFYCSNVSIPILMDSQVSKSRLAPRPCLASELYDWRR